VIGLRTVIGLGTRISRSLLLGADYYESEDMAPRNGIPPIGLGRDVVLDRVIVDKNARIGNGVRLVNEAGVQEADGNGYYIRNGIIIVPKEGVLSDGTIV
jgi:glucose-1-phosphate adenylyltransferase